MKRTERLVSILTSTCHHAACITGYVESVLAQTHPLWKQLIADAGFTRCTGDIAQHRLLVPEAKWTSFYRLPTEGELEDSAPPAGDHPQNHSFTPDT